MLNQIANRKLRLLEDVALLETVPGLRRDIGVLAAKIRYPMEEIILKVPGKTLVLRAKAVGVSRQTMWAWKNEKLRPSREQAEAIEELTGVPAAYIRAEYVERLDKGEQEARKARHKLEAAGEGLSPRPGRTRAKRRRVVAKRRLGGSPRALRRRTRNPPHESPSP